MENLQGHEEEEEDITKGKSLRRKKMKGDQDGALDQNEENVVLPNGDVLYGNVVQGRLEGFGKIKFAPNEKERRDWIAGIFQHGKLSVSCMLVFRVSDPQVAN